MGISTNPTESSALADALFPKVRQRVLAVLFGTPDRSLCVNEVIALAQCSMKAKKSRGKLKSRCPLVIKWTATPANQRSETARNSRTLPLVAAPRE